MGKRDNRLVQNSKQFMHKIIHFPAKDANDITCNNELQCELYLTCFQKQYKIFDKL